VRPPSTSSGPCLRLALRGPLRPIEREPAETAAPPERSMEFRITEAVGAVFAQGLRPAKPASLPDEPWNHLLVCLFECRLALGVNWLVLREMKIHGKHGGRFKGIIRVLFFVLAVHLLMAAGKLFLGWKTGSLAILSDGVHSLLDGASSVIGILAITVASRPPDQDHPYGHRKFEILATLGGPPPPDLLLQPSRGSCIRSRCRNSR
jgi:hypothetical protein